ncbi:glutathione S-transferase zeta class-like isoform X8 [Rhododendron vialii]|uniref:glutathione S-transferase zeta class-like isoform X8 n=1 Tax=Rhododendron vialii TaxID=182163 RepID=UPI00265EF98B|nr:glutathione S-transferase zeta class-like isoform X8 [Rhododendron vialii]
MYELFSPRPPSLGPTMVNPHDSSTPPSSISPASKVVLYSNWQSSCSWRVRFALNLKEFEKLNPLHLVPVLVDGDFVVSDSYAILMYLEEKYPENALLPVDLRLRALNLQAANIICSSVQPLTMLGVLKLIEEKVGPEERLSWAQYNIDKGFIALEKLLKNSSGKYATGDKIYMADVFLAPQIAIAARRFNMDMSKYPTLGMIFESCKALSEFEASLPERQPDAIHCLLLPPSIGFRGKGIVVCSKVKCLKL